MHKNNGHEIINVVPDSIADQLGVTPGDRLISIDGKIIEDILDYRLLINVEQMLMLIEKPDGEEWELDIENDYEDPGLEFGDGLMSEYRRCTNNCIFCFIDQMPKGMRDTLYFKDDDSRLSFLQGNYVTLTNMSDHDVERIINYRLSPINISVHTTDPELRCRMLNNRFAGESLKYLDRLYDEGIVMNGQIVLCPGYNDGVQLQKTLDDLLKYAPVMESVSVVPIGITKYREGLTKINPVDKAKALETIQIVEGIQQKALKKYDIHFAHASDEFYLLAEMDLPEEDTYDGYLQYENGVGMLRLLIEEVKDAVSDIKAENFKKCNSGKCSSENPCGQNECDSPYNRENETLSIATGKLAAPVLIELIKIINGKLASEKMPCRNVNVYEIRNEFFGESITVSGLVTGQDIIKQLKGKNLGSKLVIPSNMLRSGEEVFLDDVTVSDIEKELGVKVVVQELSGYEFVKEILE